MKQKFISFFQIFFPIILGSLTGLLIKDYIDFDVLNKPFKEDNHSCSVPS